MSHNLQKIFWIGKARESEASLSSALVKLGHSLQRVDPPTSLDPSAVREWLDTQFDGSERPAIFVEGINLKWIDCLYSQLRSHPQYLIRFSPIFWIYGTLDPELAKRVVSIGVDEILSLEANAEEISMRVQIRAQQAEALLHLQKKIDEQSRRSIASETALQQREEFLGVCAHDLRSPIGLIQSSLEVILNSKDSFSSTSRELLQRSSRQAGTAIRLVNDLLDVMSYEQGLKPQYSLFNLDTFLKEFYEDYKSQAEEKNIQFHYNNPIAQWKVLADKDRIQQLLQNLLGNALKFTEPGKNVYLNVTSFQGRRKADPPYPMVILSFRDEGSGIPQSEQEKIFDRFSQIKDYSRAGGRGLGLSVAKKISTLHAGNLWVESEQGKGSTFHVLLPHVVSRTKPVSQGRSKTILAIEPTEAKREKNFGQLERAGYQVVYVRDGVEAIAMAFHLQPKAVILRYDMHKITEAEVAKILKANSLTQNADLYLGLEEGESADRCTVKAEHLTRIVAIPAETAELFREQKKSNEKLPDAA